MWTLLLLASPFAAAHLPHTNVNGVAIPLHDPDLTWYMGIDNEMPMATYRSTDRGQTWEAFNSEVMGDEASDGAYTDDGIAVFLGVSSYWWTTDGETWSQVPIATLPSGFISPLAGGDQIYIAGSEGVYVATPGEEIVLDLDSGRASSVHDGDDGPVAIMDDGHVWWHRSGAWVDLGVPSEDDVASSGTSSDGVAWAGTDGGRVYAWEGRAWSECGVVPGGDLDTTHSQITHMDARDGRIVVTRGDVGPAISDDGCASFVSSLGPIHNDFSDVAPASSYTTNDRSFVGLATLGDEIFVAGWDGAEVTTDNGETWHIAPTVGADFTEGLALSRSFNEDGKAIMAAYGAGFTLSSGWGATATAGTTGYSLSNTQQVEIESDATGMSPMYAIVNMSPYSSLDEGLTWSQMRGPYTLARLLDVGPGARLYLENIDSTGTAPGRVIRSDDAGASWNTFDTLPAGLAAGAVQRVIDRPGWLCMMSASDTACSLDDGATWTTVRSTGSTSVRNLTILAWPDAAPTRLILSDQQGTYIWDGTTVQNALYTGSPLTIGVATDNDRFFALDHQGRLLESPDGGSSWEDTGGRVPAPIKSLRARADFAHFPDLIAGGLDGTFALHEGTVERFAAYQCVDDGTQYVMCDTCISVSNTSAILGSTRSLLAPGSLEVNLKGSTLRVLGSSSAGAVVRAWVDGTLVATAKIDPTTEVRAALIELTGLSDHWHRLELTVDVGSITMDAFDASSPSEVLATTWSEDTGDTGDSGGGEETGDTDETGDTAETGDTDETGESGDTDDSAVASDTGDTGNPPDIASPDCGCAAADGTSTPWIFGLAAMLIAARRRVGLSFGLSPAVDAPPPGPRARG